MENEFGARFADGQLNDSRRDARRFSAINSWLVTGFGSAQLIAAGRHIAERKTAVGVGPGNRILWRCFNGGQRNDRAANWDVVGIQYDSRNSTGRGRLLGNLRERRGHPAAETKRCTE